MRSLDSLLADLIAQAGMDTDQGLLDWSAKTQWLHDQVVQRFTELEKRAADGHQDRPDEANVRTVPGGQDPAGRVGGPDLSGVRRLAADPGAASPASEPAGGMMTGMTDTERLAAIELRLSAVERRLDERDLGRASTLLGIAPAPVPAAEPLSVEGMVTFARPDGFCGLDTRCLGLHGHSGGCWFPGEVPEGLD